MPSFKQFTLLGTACAALLATPMAHAQDPQRPQFYPAGKWEVRSLGDVSDYAGECIIQSEFNNGFIVQFNGSSNWVQLLNVNIRQAAFEPGQNYDVTVGVPGHSSEVISGSSERSNIISLPMKGKKDLYKLLRENAVLDLDVEGNPFRFYLTGFAKAAKSFEKCMSGGAPGRIAATNPRSSDAAGEAPKKDLMVNESIAFEQQEQDGLESGLSDFSKKPKKPAKRMSEKLAEEMEAEISVQASAAPIDDFAEEPKTERYKEPEYEIDFEEEVITPAPVMPASDVKASMSVREVKVPETPEVKVNKTVTKGDANFTKPKIEDADSAALARIVALEKELEGVKMENSALNDELKASLNEGEMERVSVASDNWNLERATMRYNEAERQLKSMGQQLQKERAQHAMEKKELETMLFDPAVTSQEQLARLSKLEKELEAARAELKRLKAQDSM